MRFYFLHIIQYKIILKTMYVFGFYILIDINI